MFQNELLPNHHNAWLGLNSNEGSEFQRDYIGDEAKKKRNETKANGHQ